MSDNERQTTVEKTTEAEAKGYSRDTIEVIRQTVFPKSDDAQLALFVHKCTSLGVHPLDGMVHPQIYNTQDGPRVVFVCSIDYMRSASEASGEYDGMDEEEFEGSIIQTYKGEDYEVPELARVKVYRKGITRPIVGVARWVEFWPGEKKGAMWIKMPHVMLGKCGEAAGRRKAFAAKLNKMYAEEEMMQATQEALSSASSKPTVAQPRLQGTQGAPKSSVAGSPLKTPHGEPPNDATRKSNKWISAGQEKRLFAICKSAGVDVDDLKAWLKNKHGKEHLYQITWAGGQYEAICKSVEEKPEFFKGKASQAEPEPIADASFADSLTAVARLAGIVESKALNKVLYENFECSTPEDVPPELMGKVIDHFNALVGQDHAGA